jgi:hypothetical protein
MKVSTRVVLLLAILVTLPVCAQSNEAEGYQKQVQVTPLLKTTVTSAGQPIAYPQIIDPEVTVLLVEIPPGTETGWHKHPFPCYGTFCPANSLWTLKAAGPIISLPVKRSPKVSICATTAKTSERSP